MTNKVDMVNRPPHYQSDNGIECIDAIRAALGLEGFIAYCRGNALKYTWREKLDPIEDMGKAQWYLNRAAEAMMERDLNRAAAAKEAEQAKEAENLAQLKSMECKCHG